MDIIDPRVLSAGMTAVARRSLNVMSHSSAEGLVRRGGERGGALWACLCRRGGGALGHGQRRGPGAHEERGGGASSFWARFKRVSHSPRGA